jgi:hypothetical protein
VEKEPVNKSRAPNGAWEWIGYLSAGLIATTAFAIWSILQGLFKLCKKTYLAKKASAATAVSAMSPPATLAQAVMGTVNPFKPATAFASMDGQGWSVTFRQYQGRIERTLKTRRERLSWQRSHTAFSRVELTAYTPEQAAAAKLSYDIHGAKLFTAKELGRRKFGQAPVTEVIESDIEQNLAPLPAAPVQAQQTEGGGVANDVSSDQSNAASKVSEATGLVTSAGVIDVQIEGRKPYKTFSMSVRGDDGLTQEFAGQDLHEKFTARAFSVGDHIKVVKSRVQFTVGGRNRSKNVFEIDVVEKCIR